MVSQQEEAFRSDLRDEKIRYRAIRPLSDAVEVTLRDAEQLAQTKLLLESKHRDMTFTTSESDGRFVLVAKFTELAYRKFATTPLSRTSLFCVTG